MVLTYTNLVNYLIEDAFARSRQTSPPSRRARAPRPHDSRAKPAIRPPAPRDSNGTRAPELCSLIGAAAPPTSAARSSIYFLEQHTRTEMRPAIIPDKGTGTDSRSRTPTPHEKYVWTGRGGGAAHTQGDMQRAHVSVRQWETQARRPSRSSRTPPRKTCRALPVAVSRARRESDHATPTTTWTSEFGNTPTSTSVCPSARSSLPLMKSLCVFGGHPVPS